jgi:hypothetical protein
LSYVSDGGIFRLEQTQVDVSARAGVRDAPQELDKRSVALFPRGVDRCELLEPVKGSSQVREQLLGSSCMEDVSVPYSHEFARSGRGKRAIKGIRVVPISHILGQMLEGPPLPTWMSPAGVGHAGRYA